METLAPTAQYFEGHFPGHPILPGVTQLILVAQTLISHGAGRHVVGIPHARFRRPVMPGEPLTLHWRAAVEGSVRFDLRTADTIAVNGEMVLVEVLQDLPGDAPDVRATVQHPPIHELLPHRPPMSFIQKVSSLDETGIICEAMIPSASPLVKNDVVPAIASIEAAAQAAAVWEALRRRAGGKDQSLRMGYLVSLRDIVCGISALPAARSFVAMVRLESAAPPLCHYAAEVYSGQRLVLRGSIGTYLAG